MTPHRRNQEPEPEPEQELVTLGPMKMQVSRETMKVLAPFVGWSLLITSIALAIAAIY
jgi:hypothetical protein